MDLRTRLSQLLPVQARVQDWAQIRKEYEQKGTALHEIVAPVDDVLERLGLGRPLSALVDLFYDISPEGLLGETLGIPSPGDIMEEIKQQIRRQVRGKTEIP